MRSSCGRFSLGLRVFVGVSRWLATTVGAGLLLASCNSASEQAGSVSRTLKAANASTGVAACDSYLDQYETCAQSVLTSQQLKQHVKGIQRQRTTWSTMADTQPKRDALSLVCRRAIVNARAEFPSCAFAGG
jgi:hypothetical protein